MKQEMSLNPENWVDEHGDILFHYALKRVQHQQTAEDLVQDTLIAALNSIDSFQGTSSERTWLIGILNHKIIDHLRIAFRETTGTDDSTVLEMFENQQFNRMGRWDRKIPNWSDPEHSAQTSEFWQVTNDCIKALPQKMATLFILREIDGVETDQLVEMLELSKSNIWTLLSRTRMKMRDCLEKRWFH